MGLMPCRMAYWFPLEGKEMLTHSLRKPLSFTTFLGVSSAPRLGPKPYKIVHVWQQFLPFCFLSFETSVCRFVVFFGLISSTFLMCFIKLDQVQCTTCNHESARYESMLDISPEIEADHIASLEDSLAQFTSTEWMDGDNKYKCEKCNDYVKAGKRFVIHEGPNVLTLALKRFQVCRNIQFYLIFLPLLLHLSVSFFFQSSNFHLLFPHFLMILLSICLFPSVFPCF